MSNNLAGIKEVGEDVMASVLPGISPLNSLTASSKLQPSSANNLKTSTGELNTSQKPIHPPWRSVVYELVLADAADKLQLLSKIANSTVSGHVVRIKSHALENANSKESIVADIDRLRKTRTEISAILRKTSKTVGSKGSFKVLADFNEKYYLAHKDDESSSREIYNKTKKELESLKSKLEQKQAENDSTIRAMDEKIQILKDTEVELKQLVTTRQKFLLKESEAKESATKSFSDIEEQHLKAEVDSFKHQIDYEKETHEQMMQFLAYQRDTIATDIEKFMEKFEQDNEAKTDELEKLKELNVDLHSKAEELETQYEILCKKLEEEKAEAKRKEEAFIRLRGQIRCARLVQRWWRKTQENRKAQKAKAKKKK